VFDQGRHGKKIAHDGAPFGKQRALAKGHRVVFQGLPKNLQHVAFWAFNAFVDLGALEALGAAGDRAQAKIDGGFKRRLLAGVDADVGYFKNHGWLLGRCGRVQGQCPTRSKVLHMNITHFKIFLACAWLGLGCHGAWAQSVAFTIDDGPQLRGTPLMSPPARNQAMLDALQRHGVKAALFVTVNYGANRPEGLALARAWGEAGHAVGNHTMSHLDLDSKKVTLAQYQDEVLSCDAIIRTLPGYQRWLRFTYLREGNTPEKRDGMRAFLKAQGYRNAYVSLDTSDWRVDEVLTAVLSKNPTADVRPIKDAYLAHIWQRAQAYRALSQRLQGRDIAQVILLHHNLVNALWLGDIIQMFKDKAWSISTPEQAFADPVYALQPLTPDPGQSLLLSMARSLGLGRFEGWQRLVDDGDWEVNALKALGLE
jgi:peptidoglycan-N-acetylglucosamine deacetylase